MLNWKVEEELFVSFSDPLKDKEVWNHEKASEIFKTKIYTYIFSIIWNQQVLAILEIIDYKE